MCHILLKNQILYFSGRLDGISSEKNVEKECTISVGGEMWNESSVQIRFSHSSNANVIS